MKKQIVVMNDDTVPARPAVSPPVQTHTNTDLPDDYKSVRIREMAADWKGTILEPYTVDLISMLLQENGELTAERRHDCDLVKHNGRVLKGCFAVGLMGHNICARGTPLVSQAAGKPFKRYCYDYAMTDFDKDYPGFATDWRIQFADYTKRATDAIADGVSVNEFIMSWNRGEGSKRLSRVRSQSPTVLRALGW